MVSPPNLWLEALSNLTPKDLERLRIPRPSEHGSTNGAVLAGLIKDIRHQQALCDQKAWKFTFGGRQIILRDVAAKIVQWIQTFREIGDIVVQYDPVHAAVPWAAVRFLIQSIVADVEQTGLILVAVETISQSILYCSLYEGICNRLVEDASGSQTSQLVSDFRGSIRRHYDEILQTMLFLRKTVARNSLKRVMVAIARPDQIQVRLATVEKQAQDLSRKCQDTAIIQNRASFQQLSEKLQELQAPITRLGEIQQQAFQVLEKQEFLSILDWCSGIEFGSHHGFICEGRTSGTGEWLIQHPFLKTWQDSSSSAFLLLYGQPGAGKTFLVSKLIDWSMTSSNANLPTQTSGHTSTSGCAYFYCSRSEKSRRSAVNVLAAFVRQIGSSFAANQVHSDLYATWFEFRKNARRLDIATCRRLLIAAIGSYTSTTLYLDAMDECEEDERLLLLAELKTLADKTTRPLKILVSSRPNPEIRKVFAEHEQLEIGVTENRDDISTFLDQQMTLGGWRNISPTVQQAVKESMIYKSQGMFQWVALQCRQLSKTKIWNETKLLQKVESMPLDLHATYDEMYAEILSLPQDEQSVALRAISWVLCAVSPLRRPWLLTAACIDPLTEEYDQWQDGLDEAVLLSLCNHFLTIDKKSGRWRFSHLSAAEYLESDPGRLSEAIHSVTSGLLKALINGESTKYGVFHISCCKETSYLEFYGDLIKKRRPLVDGPGDGSTLRRSLVDRQSDATLLEKQNFCFCDYLSMAWLDFILQIENVPTTLSQRLRRRLLDFFGLTAPVARGESENKGETNKATPYHHLCALIRSQITYGMLPRWFTVHKDKIHYAGSRASVLGTSSATLVDATCVFGLDILFSWCLKDVHAPAYRSMLLDNTPPSLSLAIVFENEGICHKLLDAIVFNNEQYLEALSFACEAGSLALIERLISLLPTPNGVIHRLSVLNLKFGDVCFKMGAHSPLLDIVMSKNQDSSLEGLKTLLRAGVDVDFTISKPDDRHFWDSYFGLHALDPNEFKVTALSLAILRGSQEMMQLLIDGGASQPSFADGVSIGHSLARLHMWDMFLLAPCYELSQEMLDYALVQAAGRGWTRHFQKLLSMGADVNASDGKLSVLSNFVASAKEIGGSQVVIEAIVKLVGLGANIRIGGGDATLDPLSVAIMSQNHTVIEKLLTSGATVRSEGGEGRLYLGLILHQNRPACSTTMRQLLAAGADPNQGCAKIDRRSILGLCIAMDCRECVSALLEYGADTEFTYLFSAQETALETAVRCSNISFITWLLDTRRQTNLSDSSLGRALALAFQYGREDVCQLLMPRIADFDQVHWGMSLLTHAARYGNLELCEALYYFGAEVNCQLEPWQCNPLGMAIYYHDEQVCEFFLSIGANVEQLSGPSQQSPLCMAIAVNDINICIMLLRARADVNRPSGNRWLTPLTLAVKQRKKALVLLLLKAGADVNKLAGRDPETPLSAAIHTYDRGLCHLLLNAGADVNNTLGTKYGSSLADALMYRKGPDSVKMATMLIRRGANINFSTKSGPGSALACAALTGNLRMCKILLSAGADVDMRLRGGSKTVVWALISAMQFTSPNVFTLRPVFRLSGDSDHAHSESRDQVSTWLENVPGYYIKEDHDWINIQRKEDVAIGVDSSKSSAGSDQSWEAASQRQETPAQLDLPIEDYYSMATARGENTILFSLQRKALRLLLESGAEIPMPLYADVLGGLPSLALSTQCALNFEGHVAIAALLQYTPKANWSRMRASYGWTIWHLVNTNPLLLSDIVREYGITRSILHRAMIIIRFETQGHSSGFLLGAVFALNGSWQRSVISQPWNSRGQRT